MNDTARTVGVAIEDTAYGPTLTVDPNPAKPSQQGVLRGGGLAMLEVIAGSSSGATYVWDPTEVEACPIS